MSGRGPAGPSLFSPTNIPLASSSRTGDFSGLPTARCLTAPNKGCSFCLKSSLAAAGPASFSSASRPSVEGTTLVTLRRILLTADLATGLSTVTVAIVIIGPNLGPI